MNTPAKVPLVEQLRRVPKDARHVVCDASKDFAESTSIPYGRMCHEAADEIESLRAALAEPAAEREGLTEDQIIAIRDSMLPGQGEAFDCIAFARAIVRAAAEIGKSAL